MAEITLEPRALLGGYEQEFGSLRLAEATGLAIVSLAIPQGDDKTCEAALQKAYGVSIPDHGRYVTSSDGSTRILRTQADQLFALFDHATPDARDVVLSDTDNAFWATDQTDNWCALEISGPAAREALARICPLDLHPDVFGPDHLGRTSMEHLGAMILRTGDEAFLLMSARSSAQSFLHAVETSITNIL